MSKAADSILRPILPAIMILSLVLAIPSQAYAQGRTPEQRVAFQALTAIEDPAARIEAAEEFIGKWPQSGYVVSCLQVAMSSAAEIDPESDLVIDYAERYIEAYSSRGEALAFAYAARQLMELGAGSGKVDEYITRALDLVGDISNPRGQSSVFTTAATIFAAKDDVDQAIDYQRKAIDLTPPNQQGRANVILAGYLVKAGQLDEAEGYLVNALLQMPDDQTAREAFDSLAGQRARGRNVESWKARVLGEGADVMLAESEDEMGTKQTLAVAFAKLGVLTDRANSYAEELAASIGPESGGAAFLAARTAVGQVRLAAGNHRGVFEALEPVRMLAGPYDYELHLALGTALEVIGQDEAAIAEYMETAALLNYPPIMERLTPLWEKVHPGESLEDYRTRLREQLESWHPEGAYDVPSDWTGKVVLAELFTGAECGPCVASDLAYDGLIAYYPRTVAAVLVHHLHIPGPDPMTNSWTEDRREYYGADVVRGTPTSIFDGTDSSVGGGGAAAGKGKFGAYGWTLEQHLAQEPLLAIDLEGDLAGDEVGMDVRVEIDNTELRGNENLRLRVVLAEKEVHYEGSNGVAEHRMVVRAFLGGADGYQLRAGKKKTRVRDSLDLSVLQSDLLTYLTDWEAENTDRFRNGPGFSRKMNEIDRSQLVLVAFVQNDETKEVYQASVFDLR